jgi:hypothetical protein
VVEVRELLAEGTGLKEHRDNILKVQQVKLINTLQVIAGEGGLINEN